MFQACTHAYVSSSENTEFIAIYLQASAKFLAICSYLHSFQIGTYFNKKVALLSESIRLWFRSVRKDSRGVRNANCRTAIDVVIEKKQINKLRIAWLYELRFSSNDRNSDHPWYRRPNKEKAVILQTFHHCISKIHQKSHFHAKHKLPPHWWRSTALGIFIRT